MNDATASAGQRLGRYHLVEPIGGGPNGEVHRAKVYGVAGFERQFAVKRFFPAVALNARYAQALSAAARAYGSLEHPRIAKLAEFGVSGGHTFTATELVVGLDCARLLAETLSSGGAIPPGAALALVSHAARAVGYAHGRGISHLGVAPTNLIVTADGDIKVTDVGILAACLPERPAHDSRFALRVHYLAPEQLVGEATSAATDVFALGVIAYELVTGSRAFAGDNAIDVAQAIVAGQPRDPNLPRPIMRVLQRCLARSPFERFPDARALADALDAAARVSPVPGTRADVSTLVTAALQRIAVMHEQALSGALSLNLPAPPPMPSVAEVGTLDETAPFDREALLGPSPDRTAQDMPAPNTTFQGIAPPPIPIPHGIAPPPIQVPQVIKPLPTLQGMQVKAERLQPPSAFDAKTPPPIPSAFDAKTPPPIPVRPPTQKIPTPPVPPLAPSPFVTEIGRAPSHAERAPTNVDAPPPDLGARMPQLPGSRTPTPAPITRTPIPGSRMPSAGVPSTESGRLPDDLVPSLSPPPPLMTPDDLAERSAVGAQRLTTEEVAGSPPAPPAPMSLLDAPIAGPGSSGPLPPMPRPTDQPTHPPPINYNILAKTSGSVETTMDTRSPPPSGGRRGLFIAIGMLAAVGVAVGGYYGWQAIDSGGEPADGSAVAATSDARAPIATATADSATIVPPTPTADAATVAAAIDGAVATDPNAALVIQSRPAGARVFLDGADQGITPTTVAGSADRHSVAIVLAGHELHVAEIEGRGTITIELKEVTPSGGPAGIKVRCKSKDRYYVFLDGKPTGQLCPTERLEVVLGDHLVEVYDLVTETRRQFPVNVDETRNSLRVRVD